MKLALAFLGLAWLAPAIAEDKPPARPESPPGWKTDPVPALTPGLIGDWDDFAIGSVSVLRLTEGWSMFYEGTAFDANGLRTALGIAESQEDGARWTKHGQNPLLSPAVDDPETCFDFSVTRWREAFWCAYVVYSDPFRTDASSGARGDGSVSVQIVRSKDGLIWSRPSIVTAPIASTEYAAIKPCLVGDETALHLWWLDRGKDEKPALAHALSRDGTTWSRPDLLPAIQIDPRPISCVRVYHSGDFYILTYVADDWEKRPRHSIVTKTSSNGRSWAVNGPPELPLVWHERHAAPVAVFSSAGARLFYTEELKDNAVVLRTAFCRKEDYAAK